LGICWAVGVVEVPEVVVTFGKIVDFWALPVGNCEVTVVFAVFIHYDFVIFLGQRSVDFFMAYRTDAFGLGHMSPQINADSASIIRAIGNKIIDIVTILSYLRTLAIVESEVTR
jgi:hypothetical protein